MGVSFNHFASGGGVSVHGRDSPMDTGDEEDDDDPEDEVLSVCVLLWLLLLFTANVFVDLSATKKTCCTS